jgi:hypothetical protein
MSVLLGIRRVDGWIWAIRDAKFRRADVSDDPSMKPSVSMAKRRDRVRRALDRFRKGNPKAFGSAARRESTAKPSSRKH